LGNDGIRARARKQSRAADDLEGIYVGGGTRAAGRGGSCGRLALVRAGNVGSWGPGGETSGKSRQIHRTKVKASANPGSPSESIGRRARFSIRNTMRASFYSRYDNAALYKLSFMRQRRFGRCVRRVRRVDFRKDVSTYSIIKESSSQKMTMSN